MSEATSGDDAESNPRDCQPIDRHVGRRVRLRRLTLGMSQEQLGTLVGISFQQVQKYEKAANRISASRLFQFAEALSCTVEFFFAGLPAQRTGPDKGAELADDIPISREAYNLLEAFKRISEPEVRRAVLSVVRSMAPELERSTS
jgi:transcriptional regulator with XRE-family HTH domain